MSIIKKSDVKNHLSARNRNGIPLHRPASQPDATGFSGEQSGHADPNASNTAEESRKGPSASGQGNLPSKTGRDSSRAVTITDSKSAQSVKLHSVFLRKDCILPDHLDPLREPIGDHWVRVEEILEPVFDTMIRQAGWHFIWVLPPCARRGLGTTPEAATGRALTRALRGVASRFNAAELDSVRVAKYPGFYIATVTLQSRQVQENTSLDHDERLPRVVAAR